MTFKINANDDFETILICATRYALGRETYMPKLVIEYITPFIPYLDNKTLGCLERDISSASNYGSEEIDKPEWFGFLETIRAEIKKRSEKDDR